MEVVQLQLRRPVDHIEHHLDREEVACDIKHDAAVSEARRGSDLYGRDAPSVVGPRDQLRQGLDAVEKPRLIRPGHGDAVC